MGQAVDVAARLDGLLERLGADAAALGGLPLGELDGVRAAAARRVLRLVGDKVQVAAAALLAAVEADGRWAAGGADRTVEGWAARREGIAYGQARREAVVGRALGDLPVARAAVLGGEITAGHLEALARVATSSPARRAALSGALPYRDEGFLVAQARRLPVDEFGKVTRRWAVAVDARAAEAEHTEAVARESLVFSRRRDGVAFTGFLTHVNAELVTTALRAVAGVPAAGDARSLEQRQAAALTDAARLVLDRGLSAKGAQLRPHLSVHVPYETYAHLAGAAGQPHRGATVSGAAAAGTAAGDAAALAPREPLDAPAELDSGEPVPPTVLARLACDADVTRIVFGPDSQVLDVGRAERTYTRQLRRAIIARDRHCQYPGCTAPPTLSEVHHIRWWSRNGPTSLTNGILLCWHHHHHTHRRDLTITRRGTGWIFTDRDGRPIASSPRGTAESGASDARPPIASSPRGTAETGASDARPPIASSPRGTAETGASDARPPIAASPRGTAETGASDARPPIASARSDAAGRSIAPSATDAAGRAGTPGDLDTPGERAIDARPSGDAAATGRPRPSSEQHSASEQPARAM